MATAQHSRQLSFGRSRALPFDRIVARRAKVIDENGVNGGTRAEGNAPCAERRDARGTLRDHAPPVPTGDETGRQRPTAHPGIGRIPRPQRADDRDRRRYPTGSDPGHRHGRARRGGASSPDAP